MPPTVLMTGANGFVGTYLRARLAERYPDTTIVPLTHSKTEPGVVAADLLDPAAVDAAVSSARPNIVVHLAARSSVARTANDGCATFAVNLGGSLNLALATLRHVPDATFLFASSSEVYGRSFLDGPASEASTVQPMNDYAKSKWLAEEMFAAVLPPTTRLIVARPFNHSGAGQSEDFVLPSFAGQVARIEAGLQLPKMQVGNLDVRRDVLDVRDVVDAYIALLDAAPTLPRRFTCNIASGTTRPLHEHVEILRQLAVVPFEVVVDASRLRPFDVPVAEGNADLLRQATGWSPRVATEVMLRDLIQATRRSLAGRLLEDKPAF